MSDTFYDNEPDPEFIGKVEGIVNIYKTHCCARDFDKVFICAVFDAF